ncbi:MAG: hypothetical protein KC549_00130, partial [Myxococcales bacterium]|nr:hypothetical protein [Myxococcales bacterium]
CDGRADEGQPDCDGNGTWDACDLQFGRQRDCDANGVPDACDIQAGAPDCDGDGIPDACNDACAVDVTPPVVNLFVQGNPINRGSVIQIVVQAQDDVGVTACQLFVGAQEIPLDGFCQAFVGFPDAGYYDVIGVARDAAGNEGRQTVRMRVLDPNDVAFPDLAIHAPPNGSTIRQPTDVVASVQDANLVEWVLSYGPQANPAANVIARGGQNVANQVIGVLDPSVIPVGQWSLRLFAEDINGRSRTLVGTFTIAACVPAAEVCDGRDNDCDQRVDEQPVDAGGPCTAGEGVCEREGVVQCEAGATRCDAQPGQPAGAEACNRLDDDCDGRVDESAACPDVSPPEIQIAVVPAVADPGTPVRVTVTATDDRGVTALNATLDGAPLALDANGVAVFNAPAQPGVHTIEATARDAAGNQASEQAELRVNAPGDVDPPVIAFSAPEDAAEIRGPTAVRGTVSDVALVGWSLAFAALDGDAELQVFATGNQNVLDAFLADLPTERMMPGYNRLRLTAEDAGGRIVFTERVVQVAAAPRPGQIRFCVNDMRVDVAGLPVTIDRCYDSRDKGRRGFGFGWTLDMSSGYVMQNRPVAQGWQHEQRCERQVLGQCIQFGCSAPETLRHMTVSFTGGDRFFRFRPEITNTSLLDGVCLGSVRWVADARTPAGWTLRTLDNTEIWLFPGESELLDQFDFTPYDPRRFELRGPNGERVVFTQGRGVDLYDNGAGVQIEFNAGGIVHSAGASLDFERDAAGSITRITDPEGASYTYAYDGRGDLVAVTDRVGATWRYQYDGNHNLTAIIRPDGTPMEATYDEEGRLTGFGLEGAQSDVVYDPDNQEVRVTDRNGDERVLVYDALGNVVSETDAEGNTVQREVDENGRITRLETPEGRVTTFTFEGTNKLPTRITSPLGHVHENTFDAEGRLRNVLLPDGRSAQLDYPPGAGTATLTVDGRVVTEIVDNAQGNTEIQRMAGGEEIRFAYDGQGRKSQVTYPDGTLERFTYDGNGRVLTQLDRAGGTTRMVYDAEGRVLSRTDACGGETRYTYDALGRQTRIVDALGRATQVEYDVAGNRSRLVQPDGAEFAWSYDAENRPLEDRLPGGLSLSRTYDSQGRTLTETDSAGGVTRYTYDGDGLHVGTALPNGLLQRMERDGEGRIISDTLPAPMAMTRDSNGYVTSMTDALGHTTRYEHTLEGMVTRELYPDGSERRFEVDADMRLTAGVDEAGGRTVFDRTYDGRVIATTLPDGARWAFDYLGTGELTSVTDPDGRETRMTFDACRRMTSLEHPDGASVDYAYDAVGNITRIDHPDGTFVERTYDAADRMIREARSDGTESRMTWTGFGRPETFTDERGVTGFTYDAAGRLTEMTQPDGARLRFGYDTAGRRVFAEARTPAGDVWRLDYLYDPVFGALAAIVQGGQAVVTYGRDAAGQLTSIDYANGISQLYMRDARGRVTQLTTQDAGGAIVADRRLTRDARGLITAEVDEAGLERRYTYDANERMIREVRVDGGATVLDRRYSYDSRGNLAGVTEAGVEDAYRLDDRSRLLEAGGRTFDYNDRGELVRITEGGQAIDLTFDLEGRLREVDGPDGNRRYRYDHLGNRVAEEVDGVVVGHLVAPRESGPDSTFRLPWTLVDYDADGRLLRGYVAGPILHGISEGG